MRAGGQRGVMVKRIEPRVEVAPFFADQPAWRAAASHLRRMSAEALPVALASTTRPSASMTTLTVTMVLWRRATSGFGQLMNERPCALPLTPTPVPPAPDVPLSDPSVEPLWGQTYWLQSSWPSVAPYRSAKVRRPSSCSPFSRSRLSPPASDWASASTRLHDLHTVFRGWLRLSFESR